MTRPKASTGSASALAGAKVLVVEDDPGTRETLAEALRLKGCAVEAVDGGEDGLLRAWAGQARARPFEVAIVDINLPGLSGLELLEALRETSPETEVIFVTAYASLATALLAIERNAFAYLVKPCDMEQVLATLQRALVARAARDAERRRSQEAVRESEERYRALVEAARDVIFTVSPAGTLTSLNPVFEAITGWSRDEWVGKPFTGLIHPDDAARFVDRFRGFLAGEKFTTQEFRVRTKAGDYRIGEVTASLNVKDNRVVGVLGIARDVTERKQAEEALRVSEERYRALFEHANDAIFTIDLQGNFTAVNRAGEQLTGYRRDESPGLNFAQILAPESLDVARQMLARKLAGGGATTYELEVITRDGQRVPLEISTRPIYEEGRLVGVQGIARDITERKRAEEALRRLNEVHEEVAKRIAHALHDEAGQVLASVYLAVAEVARTLPAGAQEKLGRIWPLLDQVDAQLRRLSHELRPTILDDLGLLPALEFLADGVSKRTGVQVTVKGSSDGRFPPVVETTLYRIVQEALNNVTKHAQARAATVSIHRDSDSVRCVVKDDGVGFDVQGMLAKRGERGLGLMGIRERLSALAGTLVIDSAPGRGTELAITLPLKD